MVELSMRRADSSVAFDVAPPSACLRGPMDKAPDYGSGDSGFDSLRRYILFHFALVVSRTPMDTRLGWTSSAQQVWSKCEAGNARAERATGLIPRLTVVLRESEPGFHGRCCARNARLRALMRALLLPGYAPARATTLRCTRGATRNRCCGFVTPDRACQGSWDPPMPF